MACRRHDSQAGPSRVLVVADAGVDPHQLATLCCERPDGEVLSVFLLPIHDAGAE
jgi:hypothetical protein